MKQLISVLCVCVSESEIVNSFEMLIDPEGRVPKPPRKTSLTIPKRM